MMVEHLGPGDEYDVARNVQRVHQTRWCINCTSAGCVALMGALETIARVTAERTQQQVTAILLNGTRGTIADTPDPDADQ